MWHHCIKMEFQKIANFLNTTSDDKYLPRFATKKWIEVYDQSGGYYPIDIVANGHAFINVCSFINLNSWCFYHGSDKSSSRKNAKRRIG